MSYKIFIYFYKQKMVTTVEVICQKKVEDFKMFRIILKGR